MKFLDRILGRRSELPELPPGCKIYWDATRVLIAPVLHDVTGGSWPGDPVTVLPHDAPPDAIGAAVLGAVGASRGGLSAEAAVGRVDALIKAAGARSLDAIEKRSELIAVCAAGRGAELNVVPMQRYETGGHVISEGDPIYRRPASAAEIGPLVRELLDRPARPPQRRAR